MSVQALHQDSLFRSPVLPPQLYPPRPRLHESLFLQMHTQTGRKYCRLYGSGVTEHALSAFHAIQRFCSTLGTSCKMCGPQLQLPVKFPLLGVSSLEERGRGVWTPLGVFSPIVCALCSSDAVSSRIVFLNLERFSTKFPSNYGLGFGLFWKVHYWSGICMAAISLRATKTL